MTVHVSRCDCRHYHALVFIVVVLASSLLLLIAVVVVVVFIGYCFCALGFIIRWAYARREIFAKNFC